MLDYLRDKAVQLVVIGSAFFWSWLDALFIGLFFGSDAISKIHAAVAIMVGFGSGSIIYVLTLARPQLLSRLFSKKSLIILAILALLGGVLMTGGNVLSLTPLVVVGAIAVGLDLGVLIIGWGRCYARDGARSASIEVAGAFSLALLIDLPILLMVVPFRSLASALLPLVSTVFLIILLRRVAVVPGAAAEVSADQTTELSANPSAHVAAGPPAELSAPPAQPHPPAPPLPRQPAPASAPPAQPHPLAVSPRLRRRLQHLPLTLLLASFIFMVAFGYMQYYSSFSPMDSGNNSTVIQVVRGLGAFAFFLSVLMFQWKPHIIYRIGFIFMITGYLLQPFFAQTPASLMIFGTVTMIGYVCFDIFIWVVLSEIVHVNQRSSAGAIALMWLVRATGIVVGMLVCHALFFFGEPLRLIPSGTVLVGYLTVIAMTLLLGDETGIWAIIRQGSLMRQQATAGEAAGEALSGAASGREAAGEALLSGAASGREAAGAGDRMAEYGFTPRQREVIDLVLSGRSAARIAVELGVSENTVVTHIRHIYRITGVNSRQDLIDALTDR